MSNKVKMTIYVSKELHKHYKIRAAYYDKTVSQSVEDAMTAYIKPIVLKPDTNMGARIDKVIFADYEVFS